MSEQSLINRVKEMQENTLQVTWDLMVKTLREFGYSDHAKIAEEFESQLKEKYGEEEAQVVLNLLLDHLIRIMRRCEYDARNI